MAATDKEQLPQPQSQDKQVRCPACSALPHLHHAILDTRNGKTVQVYRCQCGKSIWEA
jgi:hypothetical protein